MSVWLTEKEFRQSGADAAGMTLNVAFLREIKQDHLPVREQAKKILDAFSSRLSSARSLVEMLNEYRESIETYFTLEEFYGYFSNAAVNNPNISGQAGQLQQEHESLFLKLNSLIDLAEQIVYHECDPKTTMQEVGELFEHFSMQFEYHEQQEMELMMRLCNEEIGVGD